MSYDLPPSPPSLLLSLSLTPSLPLPPPSLFLSLPPLLPSLSPSPSLFLSPSPSPQMRAIKDAIKDDKLTLPKWSRPITVPLEKLQPPEITTSDITSITLTRAPGSAQFTISTEGMLSWEDDGEAEFYEVWAGSRRVEEFEEPDRTYGEIYRVHTMYMCILHACLYGFPYICIH